MMSVWYEVCDFSKLDDAGGGPGGKNFPFFGVGKPGAVKIPTWQAAKGAGLPCNPCNDGERL